MNALPRVLAVTCLLLLSSCGNIRLTEPLAGSTAPEIREKLTGNWVADGEVIQVAFDEQGKGQLAYLDRNDQGLHLGKGEIAAIDLDGRHFLSVRLEEDGQLLNYHLFVEYTNTDEEYLIIWPPKEEAFEKAIIGKALDGTVTKSKNSVTLLIKSPAEKILDFLEQHPDAFETREPKIYRRLK